MIRDLTAEINQLQQSASTSNQLHESRKRKYQPKTRPEVEMADYIEIGPNDAIPEVFHLLSPGSGIAVNSLWLNNTLSVISNQRYRKEKKAVKKGKGVRENRDVEILKKKLMDGFFYPWDLAVEGVTAKFQANPVYKGLQLYATHHLKMDIPFFKKCWNAKMVSARQTLKRLSSLSTNSRVIHTIYMVFN
ncbi:uncharacterized protein LOC125671983 [Ostrea edulis]|uniref:uncharacterized protein LOC125671983 n=1 Tax=Ostrea edulis TaxID=37623 RepID=UPI0020951C96|nr:uncharacterized protein LOC125671983 [Ostrea edulis]